MKNYYYSFLSTLCLCFIFYSCDLDDDLQVTETINQTELINKKNVLKESFGFALVNSLTESQILRETIKEEALKMFNKDYEVLVYSILDKRLENGKTFEQQINSYASNKFTLQSLLDLEPTLTILVPELPMNTFSAQQWDTTNEVPAIAIRTNTTNEIPLITPENEIGMIPNDAIPGFPVLVIKNNERVISNIENTNYHNLKTRIVYEKNGIEFKFWSDSFDNEKNENYLQRRTTNIDQVLEDAYNIYEQQKPGLNGWQRDYVYYDIQPSNPDGPFKYNFQEHIRSFAMTGNAMNAYNKISDQTGDPRYNNNHRINTSHWTGGFYEFKVRTVINAKNGVGNELINGFTVSPSELFYLEYERYTKGQWFWKKTYYRLKNIYNKSILIDIPIINWDLDEYASSIKIEIEEVDLTTTTAITDTRTVKFATNFQISPSLGEKIKLGLKFGASLETTQTHTVKKSFTQGNDLLGEAIVNFADKVVLGRSRSGSTQRLRWKTRDYTTGSGYCKFSVEPKRVQ